MRRSIYFALGVSGLAWIGLNSSSRFSTGSLILVLGYAVLGWFCYAMSAGRSPRVESKVLAFGLGLLAMLIQLMVIKYVVAHATDIQGFASSKELADAISASRMLVLIAWFSVPLILCSLVAGRIARRSGA